MMLTSVQSILEALRTHQILNGDELAHLPPPDEADDAVAYMKTLVRLGKLTLFQAKRVMNGRTNELVVGPYVLLDMIGEGGMGIVFKAVLPRMGRIVALKIVRSQLLSNPNALKRFEREVRAAARLEHPNIVRLFDADSKNGHHFLAMEFVNGNDLGSIVRKDGPFSIPQSIEIIRQAALGLQHAHDQGFVHRDIKPSNILLTNEGTAKILDMGLARQFLDDESSSMTSVTQDGTVVGTPDFMAPEQAKNSKTVDTRADLYSLGCSFYFLLTGRPPFPEGSAMEKLLRHQLDPPPDVRLLRPEIPDAVASIIHSLLAKNPADRIPSAAQLAEALADCLGGASKSQRFAKPISVPPPASSVRHIGTGNDFDFDAPTETMTPFQLNDAVIAPQALAGKAVRRSKLSLYLGVAATIVTIGILILVVGNLSEKPTKPEPEVVDNPSKPPVRPPLKQPDPKQPEPKLPGRAEVDSFLRFLPDDVGIVFSVNLERIQGTKFFDRQIRSKIAPGDYAGLKQLFGTDPLTLIDRVVLVLGSKSQDDPLIILQSREELLTPRTESALEKLIGKPTKETLLIDRKNSVAMLKYAQPEKKEPLYLVQTSRTTLLLSNSQDRLRSALGNHILKRIRQGFDDESYRYLAPFLDRRNEEFYDVIITIGGSMGFGELPGDLRGSGIDGQVIRLLLDEDELRVEAILFGLNEDSMKKAFENLLTLFRIATHHSGFVVDLEKNSVFKPVLLRRPNTRELRWTSRSTIFALEGLISQLSVGK